MWTENPLESRRLFHRFDNWGDFHEVVTDTSENRQWLKQFKDRWKTKLEQVDLWVISYRIEVEDCRERVFSFGQ